MKKLLWTTNCKLKNWWLWKVHLSTGVVFDKIYLIPDIRRHPHLVPCHFVLTSEVIAHRLYLDMLFHFLSLKTTLKKRQIFSISAAPEERNFFDQIVLTKDNQSHKQFLKSEMIDFEVKNWNGYITRLRSLDHSFTLT